MMNYIVNNALGNGGNLISPNLRNARPGPDLCGSGSISLAVVTVFLEKPK